MTMTKIAPLFSGAALAAALGLAGVPGASAEPLAPIEGRGIDLGRDVHGTVYWVAERDGAYLVVATVASGPDGTPVRFEAALADGQRVELSTPREAGQPARTFSIRRTGGRVGVSESGGPKIID